MKRILVVDDEQSLRELLSMLLRKEGYFVEDAPTGESALAMLQSDIFDLVITDVKMPKVSGIDLLRSIKEIAADTIVIVITAYATPEEAVEAMKLGAYDYITKPFKNEAIKLVVQKALEKQSLRQENILLRRAFESRAGFENFIGRSDAMQRIFSVIRQVADTRTTVLVTGESGTGKELVARAIHSNGSRKSSPFVSVNCSALPETLLESELFGYMKGAFTGASANKQGLFEAANGGTIFLDEISTTSLSLQAKLLRVLQEREFKRVGGTADIKVDVRVIAATNKDLLHEVSRGNFREDLFYRLNVIPIVLPPLRERREDIPLLAEHFLKKYGQNRPPKRVAPDVMQHFLVYRWPGNVRELENTIERLVILSPDETIALDHLPEVMQASQSGPARLQFEIPESGIDLEGLLQTTEKTLLFQALAKAGGVKTEAAKLLGLSFRSFRHRLQKYEPAADAPPGTFPLK